MGMIIPRYTQVTGTWNGRVRMEILLMLATLYTLSVDEENVIF
jgi:hypothetical protein